MAEETSEPGAPPYEVCVYNVDTADTEYGWRTDAAGLAEWVGVMQAQVDALAEHDDEPQLRLVVIVSHFGGPT